MRASICRKVKSKKYTATLPEKFCDEGCEYFNADLDWCRRFLKKTPTGCKPGEYRATYKNYKMLEG